MRDVEQIGQELRRLRVLQKAIEEFEQVAPGADHNFIGHCVGGIWVALYVLEGGPSLADTLEAALMAARRGLGADGHLTAHTSPGVLCDAPGDDSSGHAD